MNVQAVEAAPLTLLRDHSDGAAPALFIECEGAIARPWHQFGKPLRRRQHADRQSCQAYAEDSRTQALVLRATAPHGNAAGCRSNQRQYHQGANQPQFRHQHKTHQHDAGDTAQCIECDHRTDIPADLAAVDRQAQGQGKRRAQQGGRQKHHTHRCRGKPR
ncbi:hypothetical protein D3C77_438530 [compost metagenome]